MGRGPHRYVSILIAEMAGLHFGDDGEVAERRQERAQKPPPTGQLPPPFRARVLQKDSKKILNSLLELQDVLRHSTYVAFAFFFPGIILVSIKADFCD